MPDAILNKPGKLIADEFEIIKRHPVTGEQILAPVPFLADVRRIVRHDHERWDGTGYPDGLRGAQIPIGARIVFVVDAFHAMTSDRPYRMGMGDGAARAELRAGAGTQFDPEVVDALLAILDRRTPRSLLAAVRAEIPYTIRRSDRARRVRVTVDAVDGVEVVLPRRARGARGRGRDARARRHGSSGACARSPRRREGAWARRPRALPGRALRLVPSRVARASTAAATRCSSPGRTRPRGRALVSPRARGGDRAARRRRLRRGRPATRSG